MNPPFITAAVTGQVPCLWPVYRFGQCRMTRPRAGTPDAGGREPGKHCSTAQVCSHQRHLQQAFCSGALASHLLLVWTWHALVQVPRRLHKAFSWWAERKQNSSKVWGSQRSLFYFPLLAADTKQYWECKNPATHEANHILRLQL